MKIAPQWRGDWRSWWNGWNDGNDGLATEMEENMDFGKELEGLAQRYQSEGYPVIVHPQAEQLPPFVKDFGVDMLVTRGDEPNGLFAGAPHFFPTNKTSALL